MFNRPTKLRAEKVSLPVRKNFNGFTIRGEFISLKLIHMFTKERKSSKKKENYDDYWWLLNYFT
jgi:hypothetical protein